MKYHIYNRIFLDPPLRINFTCFSQFEKGANYLPSSLFPFKKTHSPKEPNCLRSRVLPFVVANRDTHAAKTLHGDGKSV